ncbi:MAG: DUF2384 domain-containing protein [Planctomycetes bacterium]|nr:DUF2384 domain-containing protein [Planctomycetota bacterium]
MSSQVLPGAATKPALSYLAHLGISGDLHFAEGVRLVARGLPYKAWLAFARATTLGPRELAAAIGIAERTIARRKTAGRLHPDESDRLARVARIFDLVLQFHEGDRDAALRWLSAPQVGLGGAVPLAVASSDLGAREIETLIGRLEHGVIA